MNCWQVQLYLACNTYLNIHHSLMYTYKTKLYTIHNICVNCHNMRNLYHIHVIDRIQLYMCVYISFPFFQAEVKLEYLLNLSILISKGKEIN